MDDPVSRLLEAIEQAEHGAGDIHALTCNRVLGSMSGNLNDSCDCGEPDRIRRRCTADRNLVALHGRMWIKSGHPYFNDEHLTREPMALCRTCEPERMWRREKSWPCRTLLNLVKAYHLTDLFEAYGLEVTE